MCFIRPIQKDLDCSPVEIDEETCCKETCFTCGKGIPIHSLRDHVQECRGNEEETNENIDEPRKIDRPICGFICKQKQDIFVETESDKETKESTCPLCLKKFSESVIQEHAAVCGEEEELRKATKESVPKSLEEEIESKYQEVENSKDIWTIHVVRRRFIQTASEELNDASEEDWEKPTRVTFIGEEGLDSGGLRREFFTLLFKQADVFEGSSFRFDANLLANKQYKLIGKATAVAVLNGHPGPRRFNKFLAEYIVKGQEPEAREMTKEDIDRADVMTLLNELESSHDLGDVSERYIELFQVAGFRKLLSENSKEEAVNAIKGHFLFYEKLGPLLQYMEGLRLHGMLDCLQRHTQDGLTVFMKCKYPSATEISQFFVPYFSSEETKKALEEVAIYHFNKFLKKVERGSVSTISLEIWDNIGEEQTKTLTTADVVQAFVGSDSLPRSVTTGMIEFNHFSKSLSTVNTCAPSLAFCNIAELQSYDKFENHMINIIVGAPEFGIE